MSVIISSVEKNSPAEKGGIKAGDVILTMNEQEVNTLCKLREVLFSRDIGEFVTVLVKRGEDTFETKIQLSKKA